MKNNLVLKYYQDIQNSNRYTLPDKFSKTNVNYIDGKI